MQTSSVIERIYLPTWAISRRLPALGVLAFGLVLLYGIGFSTLPAAHNTTHDLRHTTGFPCH